MGGPLANIRIVDLSRVLAGPWAGQLLADYGAEVIKIERPGRGDDTRGWGPPWLDGERPSDSAYFLSCNRNKLSVTCNLAHPDGARIVRELVAKSDVVLENYRVGSLARYGLDAASLCGEYPSLIYCSISAFGQSGPNVEEPGYDAMIQAAAGLMSITGEAAEAGGRPQKVGVAIADIMAGMYAATAILAALNERQTSGRGQHIDVPLFDSQVAWLANQAMNYLVGEQVPGRHGTAHPNIVPYQAFATADDDLMLAVGTDEQFRACVEELGLAELADDARFLTNADRVQARDVLLPLLAERLRTAPAATWLARFKARGIPCGAINDLQAVFDTPQVNERHLVRRLDHGSGKRVPTVANPVSFSRSPVEYRAAPPLLGEHTSAVLRDLLGYEQEEIDRLADSGAL